MKYDLEQRTFSFTVRVRDFVWTLHKNMTNNEYVKQLVRSSASVGANYIEANESLSRKDYFMRVKICRKEAKESIYWLNLLVLRNPEIIEQKQCIEEATQLMKIFGKILGKAQEVTTQTL